jgi:hypothetical protein
MHAGELPASSQPALRVQIALCDPLWRQGSWAGAFFWKGVTKKGKRHSSPAGARGCRRRASCRGSAPATAAPTPTRRSARAAGASPPAGRGRCTSTFLDKNRLFLGKSQSQHPPKRTQRPPHRAEREVDLGGEGIERALEARRHLPVPTTSRLVSRRACRSFGMSGKAPQRTHHTSRPSARVIDAPCTHCLRHGDPMHAHAQEWLAPSGRSPALAP